MRAKQEILEKVEKVVNPGGVGIIYGTLIDEERRNVEMGLMMSLNMLNEMSDGFNYTSSQCIEWLHEVRFEGGESKERHGHEMTVVARK